MIRNRFHVFLVASLLVHGAVLVAWPGSPLREIAIESAPPLQLALRPENNDHAAREQVADTGVVDDEHPRERHRESTEDSAASDSGPVSAPPRPASSVPETLAKPAPAQRPQPAQQPQPVPLPRTSAAAPAGAESDTSEASAPPTLSETAVLSASEIRARVHEAVETHFHYPRLAQRRGWEGEVRVGVRVDGNGRVSAVEVVASSGYRVLDRAAVDSLKRVARLRETGGLPAAGVEFELPVRYVLLDGQV